MSLPVVGERVMWDGGSGTVVEVMQDFVELDCGAVTIDWTIVVQDDDGVLNWMSPKDLDGYKT